MLKTYLEQMSLMELSMLKRLPKHKSLNAFLLKHGRAFEPRPRPKGFRKGKMGFCFQNCISFLFKHARRSSFKLIYCEGYAMQAALPIPMLHGWLCDEAGNVIDLTWDNVGEYWGVPFNLDFVMAETVRNGVYGIFGDTAPSILFGKETTRWKDPIKQPLNEKKNDEHKQRHCRDRAGLRSERAD